MNKTHYYSNKPVNNSLNGTLYTGIGVVNTTVRWSRVDNLTSLVGSVSSSDGS